MAENLSHEAGLPGQQTLTKRDLAERLSSIHPHLNQMQALTVMQTLLDEIVTELSRGNRIEFRDFGVFDVVHRKSRTALNPKTLDKVMVPERMVVKFKPGRLLKAQVIQLPPH